VINGVNRAQIALCAPSTRASAILVQFESTHTKVNLVALGGLVP